MPPFQITLSKGSLQYQLMVTLVSVDAIAESFKVYPPSNPEKYIIIQNNRPLLRNVCKQKNKPLTWKLVAGSLNNERNYKQVLNKISRVLEPVKPRKKTHLNNSLSSRRRSDLPSPPSSR